MAIDADFTEGVSETYRQMSLEEKVGELERLKKGRMGVERERESINFKINLLEQIPEVARYYVERIEFAVALLNRLKQEGEVSYMNFTKGYSGPVKADYYAYLHLLKTANFIEFAPNPKDEMDVLLRVTKEGRKTDFEYDGRAD